MFNKKRLFVAGAFIIALLFMTMYAGTVGEQETTAMRIVKFIDGFNNAEISSQNIEVGGDAEVPTDPKHEDLLFIGWYDGDTRVTKFTNIMEDLTVTSQYVDDINNNGIADSEEDLHTVTFFDTVAGTNISQAQVLDGMSATAPTPRVHEGYTFTGWSRGFTNVTSNFRVDALYRTTEELDETITYTVRFLVGDEVISTQTIESGASATAPDAPSISKKVFIGWDTSFDEVTTDLTVKAVYADDINENNLNDETETRYTVAFVAGVNGTLEGTTEFANLLINLSLADNEVTIPTPEPVAGYAFAGWNVELTNETKVAGNTTYTANFKDSEKPTIQITYPLEGEVYKKADVKITKNSSDNVGLDTIYTALYKEDGTLVKDKTKELKGLKTKTSSSNYLTTTELPDGKYYFEVYVTDLTGNESINDKVNFIIDSTSPIVTFIPGGTNEWTNQRVNFKVNIEEANGYSIAKTKWIKGNTIPTDREFVTNYREPHTTPKNYNGEYSLWAYVVDNAGNVTKVGSKAFKLDVKAPTAPIIVNSSAGKLTKEKVTITWESTDVHSGISFYEYTYDLNGTWTQVNPSEATIEINEEFKGTLYVRATDKAGNVSEVSNTTINIDQTKPIASITSPAQDGLILRDNITITGEVDSSEVNMNRHWFEITTPSGKIYYEGPKDTKTFDYSFDLDTTFGDGEYRIRYVATDLAGNRSDDPNRSKSTIRTIIVDTTAPDVPLITAEDDYKAGTWVNKDVTLRFTSNDNFTQVEKLRYVTYNSNESDVTKWTDIVNPITYISNTYNNVYVRAIDEAGNYSEPSKFFQVKVDKTNPKTPEVNMNEYIEGTSTNKKVTLEAYGSEEVNNNGAQISNESPIRYQYKINNGEWVDLAKAEIDYDFDGTVTFRTADEAGNYSEPTEPINVLVDVSAPDVPLITAEDDYKAGTWVNKDVTLRFTSNDNFTQVEKLRYVTYNSNESDVTKWTDIVNPITYISNTYNNVYVRAIDEAGNYSEPSKFFQVKVDKTNPKTPEVNMNEYIEGTSTNKKVTLEAYGSEEVNNNGAQISNESPIRYQYKINNGEWVDLAKAEIDYDFDGTVTFRTADEAGNYSEPTEPINVLVDVSAPDVPLITAEDDYKAGTWVNKDVTLRFTSNDNFTQVEKLRYVTYNSNESDVTKWTDIVNPITYISNTYNNVYVRAIDEAGNYSEPSKFFQVKVDKTNPKTPEVNMNEYIEGTSTNKKVTLEAYGSEEVNNNGAQISNESPIRYQYKINNGEWVDLAKAEIDYDFDGTVTFRTADEAGNYSDEKSVNVIIDKTAPYVSNVIITPLINTNIGGKNVRVEFDLNDTTGIDLSRTYVMFADGPNTNYLPKESMKLTPILISGIRYYVEFNTTEFVIENYVGNYNLQFTMVDILGNNTSSKPKEFRPILIDNSGPSSTLISPIIGSAIKGTTRFEFEVEDDTGVSSGYMKLINSEFEKRYDLIHDNGKIWYVEIDTTELANENYTIDARFEDSFGTPRYGKNKGNVIIENIEPLTGTISYSPETPTNLAVTATIKFNAPVTVPVNLEDIWIPTKEAECHFVKTRLYCDEWKQTYLNNTEEQPEFTAEDGKKSNPVVTIDKIDRNLNEAVVTKTVAPDEKSVLVTLTADEEIIVESSGWTKKSANIWEKTYTENNWFNFITYRDLARNYKTQWIPIYEIDSFSLFNTIEETTNEFSTTTDEETLTSDVSTVSEENTLFDETIEGAYIKSDEPEVIETTEENN